MSASERPATRFVYLDELRRACGGPHSLELMLVVRARDEHQIGAQVGEGASAPQSLVETARRAGGVPRVGPPDDQDVRGGIASPHRGLHAALRILTRDHAAGRAEVALGRLLVLEHQAGGASRGEAANRALDVRGAAEPGVGVDHQRDRGRRRHIPDLRRHLAVGEEARVRRAELPSPAKYDRVDLRGNASGAKDVTAIYFKGERESFTVLGNDGVAIAERP